MLKPEHDMLGDHVGCLSVIERANNTADGNAQWFCLCNLCSSVSIIPGFRLRQKRMPWKRCPKCRRAK